MNWLILQAMMNLQQMMTSNNFIAQYQQRIEAVLAQNLAPESQHPMRLHQAMRYAILDGGKRIRPLLVYVTGDCLNVELNTLDIAAAAVEMIHCYSLVHDDLPAMDNDDLRRGKPTCHKAFDEATAILAGDAIQANAFTLLAEDSTNSDAKRVKMLQVLGYACGSFGMAGGQAIDLAATGQSLTLEQLENMHQLKTGALIEASVLLAAIVADVDEHVYQSLASFAKLIGLAFQIQDDILDIESDTATLGKQQGADVALNKATFPALLGLEEAKHYLQQTYQAALNALINLGPKMDALRELAAYIVQREH